MPGVICCCVPPCTGCVDSGGSVVNPPTKFQVVISGVTFATSCTYLTSFQTFDGDSSFRAASMKVRSGTCNGTFCLTQTSLGSGYCQWEATLPTPIIVDSWEQWSADPSDLTPNCVDTFSGTTPHSTITLDKIIITAAQVPVSGVSGPIKYDYKPSAPTEFAWQFWCRCEKDGGFATPGNAGGGSGTFRAFEFVDATTPNCTRNAIYSNLCDRYGVLYPPGFITSGVYHWDYPLFGVGQAGSATIVSDGC